MIETEKIYKYRIRLSKKKDSLPRPQMRHILCDAVIKSGINYAKSKNWPKVALGPCAPDGEESICEYADICLKESFEAKTLDLKLAPFITGGFKIENITEVPYSLCSLESLCGYAGYLIWPADDKLKAALDKSKAEIEILHENGFREFKRVRHLIHTIRSLGPQEVEIIAALSVLRSFGFERILLMLLGLEGGAELPKILRRELYWESSGGSLEPVQQEKH